MNILVCIKQVPDDFVKVHLGDDGRPAVADIEKVVNAFDTYAVEMAVRYCEEHGGKVVVATIGEEKVVRSSIVQMVAVGAKQGYICKPAVTDGDEKTMAYSLAELIKKCEKIEGVPFDLILCGKESTDEISSQVGAMLAEKLNLGFVSSVVDFEPWKQGFRIKQETETGFAYYETATPAVLTIAKPAYDPRYPTLKGKMAARKANIPYFTDVLTKKSPSVKCIGYFEPEKREAGVKIHEKEAADAVAKAIEMMINDKVL